MLAIQPEDRPTVAGALSHGWFVDLKNGNEDSRGDPDETTQSQDQNTVSRKHENRLVAHNGRKRSRSENNPITQDNARYIPEGAAPGADAASSRTSVVQARRQGSKPMSYNFQATHSKGLEAQGGEQVGDILPTYLQGRTPNAKLNLNVKRVCNEGPVQAVPQLLTPTSEIVSGQPHDQMPQPNTRQRKRKNPPPPFSMKLRRELLAGQPSLPSRARSGVTIQKIQTTKPNTRGRVDGRNRNVPTINSMHDPNSREKSPARQDPNVGQTPNPGRSQTLSSRTPTRLRKQYLR